MSNLLLLLLPVWAFADGNTRMLGTIYYPDSKTTPSYLYEKQITETPGSHVSKVRYSDMTGKVLVEEEFSYQGDNFVHYSYKQNQTNESGEIKIENNKIFYSFTKQGKTDTDSDKLEADSIASDMIPELLQKNWELLEKGESVKVRFLLVEHLDSVGFKFFKDKERDFQGTPAVDIIMKPSSFIIAALAPSIRLTLSKAPPHRLLETNGRLPIRVAEVPEPKSRKDWHAIDARMILSYP